MGTERRRERWMDAPDRYVCKSRKIRDIFLSSKSSQINRILYEKKYMKSCIKKFKKYISDMSKKNPNLRFQAQSQANSLQHNSFDNFLWKKSTPASRLNWFARKVFRNANKFLYNCKNLYVSVQLKCRYVNLIKNSCKKIYACAQVKSSSKFFWRQKVSQCCTAGSLRCAMPPLRSTLSW